jgi:hypothetical protein
VADRAPGLVQRQRLQCRTIPGARLVTTSGLSRKVDEPVRGPA